MEIIPHTHTQKLTQAHTRLVCWRWTAQGGPAEASDGILFTQNFFTFIFYRGAYLIILVPVKTFKHVFTVLLESRREQIQNHRCLLKCCLLKVVAAVLFIYFFFLFDESDLSVSPTALERVKKALMKYSVRVSRWNTTVNLDNICNFWSCISAACFLYHLLMRIHCWTQQHWIRLRFQEIFPLI